MAQKSELESKMKDCKSAVDFALLAMDAASEPADREFAKELLEKAEGMAGLPLDFIKVAEAYIKIFDEKEKAEELYDEAEDACFEPLESAELGHSIAISLGNKEKAKELLESAAAGAKKVPELMTIATYVSSDLGDEDMAKELIGKVESELKTYDDYLKTSETLIAQANIETAKSIFHKALSKISDIPDVVKYAKKIKELFDDDEWAKEVLEDVVDDAQFTNDLVMLAEVYHDLGDDDKADELIEQGADFAMQGEEFINLAKVFMGMKQDFEKAREFFEKGLKDIRDKSSLIAFAKEIAEKMKDKELAMKFFKQAESKSVSLKDYLTLAAETKESINDIEYIDHLYTIAEEKAESFDDLKTLAANILEKVGNREKALAVYDKVLSSVQKITQYFVLLKDCIEKLNDKDFARRIMDDAFAKAENSPDMIQIAEAVIKDIDDRDYAKQILERAEEIVTTLDELKAVDKVVKHYFTDDDEWLKRLDEKLEKREKNQAVYDEFQHREKNIKTFKDLLKLNDDMMEALDDFYYSKKLLIIAETMLKDEFFNFDKYTKLIEAIHKYLRDEDWIVQIIETAYDKRVQFIFELDALCRAALHYLSEKERAKLLVGKFTQDFELRLDNNPDNDGYDYIKLAEIVMQLLDDRKFADSLLSKAIGDSPSFGLFVAIGLAYHKFADETKAMEFFTKAFNVCESSADLVATAKLILNGDVAKEKVKELYLKHKSKAGEGIDVIGWISGLVELFGDFATAEKEYKQAAKKLSRGDRELLDFNRKVYLGEEVF